MNSFFISGSCLCETMKLSNPSPGYINFNSHVFFVFEIVTEITFFSHYEIDFCKATLFAFCSAICVLTLPSFFVILAFRR